MTVCLRDASEILTECCKTLFKAYKTKAQESNIDVYNWSLRAYPFTRAWSLLRPAGYCVLFRIGVYGPVGTLNGGHNKAQFSPFDGSDSAYSLYCSVRLFTLFTFIFFFHYLKLGWA